MSESKLSYEKAGVSIDAGNELVRRIAPMAKGTARPGSDPELGGFGGFFDLKAVGYRDPILVACSDGVGTKIKIAIEYGSHHCIGVDLVAMCVNDLIVQGAEPLFFLDYYAAGELDVAIAERVIAGIAEGCRESGCALIGGESAEMPGLYRKGEYDLAGFAVGVVERDQILSPDLISPNDVIIGLRSSGLHCNGFSLVRKVVDDLGLRWEDTAPFNTKFTLAEILLNPTLIYVQPVLSLIREGLICGLANITGGGLLENIPRILPDGCRAHLDADSWKLPDVCRWLRDQAGLDPKELLRTFNNGIGMALIVKPENQTRVIEAFRDSPTRAEVIGIVDKGVRGIDIAASHHTSWGYMDRWECHHDYVD